MLSRLPFFKERKIDLEASQGVTHSVTPVTPIGQFSTPSFLDKTDKMTAGFKDNSLNAELKKIRGSDMGLFETISDQYKKALCSGGYPFAPEARERTMADILKNAAEGKLPGQWDAPEEQRTASGKKYIAVDCEHAGTAGEPVEKDPYEGCCMSAYD